MVTAVKPKAPSRALLNAAELEIPYAMNVMAVTREFLQKNPDTVERAMKAYIEAVGVMNRDKDATLRVLAKYFKRNDPSFLEETYGIVTKFTEKTPRVDVRNVATVLEFEPVKGIDAESLTPKVIDNSIVDKLAREGFIEKIFGNSAR